ncbi:MAG: alternative ribosome rescue aminoacyl-tRNA hydrolase ArfB [Candidatus Nanopelagicales bacterium]
MSDPGGDLPIRGSVAIPAAELRWRFSRSSGPGGQSVNTADSRVELRYDLAGSAALPPSWRDRALARLGGRLVDGEVVVVASEHRSQWRNREAALRRLADLLREATAPPARPRRATRPTRSSVERRLRTKQRRSEVKRGRRSRGDD